MKIYPERNPYLYWFDGSSFHIEQWTRSLSEEIEPTSSMKYYEYLHGPDSSGVYR